MTTIVESICPKCLKKSITGGRCIMCGWISEYRMERIHHHANMINMAYDRQIESGLLEYLSKEEILEHAINCVH